MLRQPARSDALRVSDGGGERFDQPGPLKYLKAILFEEIGLSEKSAALLIDEYGELAVQRHAMYCLWMMDQGRVRNPIG